MNEMIIKNHVQQISNSYFFSRGGTIIRPLKMTRLDSSPSISMTSEPKSQSSSQLVNPLQDSTQLVNPLQDSSPAKTGLFFKRQIKTNSYLKDPDKRREAIFKK